SLFANPTTFPLFLVAWFLRGRFPALPLPHAEGARKHADPRPAVLGLQGQRNAHHEASRSSAQPAGSAHPVRAADTSDLWETSQPLLELRCTAAARVGVPIADRPHDTSGRSRRWLLMDNRNDRRRRIILTAQMMKRSENSIACGEERTRKVRSEEPTLAFR